MTSFHVELNSAENAMLQAILRPGNNRKEEEDVYGATKNVTVKNEPRTFDRILKIRPI